MSDQTPEDRLATLGLRVVDGGLIDPDVDVPPPGDADVPVQLRRTDNDPRYEITVTADQPAVVDAAERALLAMGGVYVRGRQLVRVVRDRGAPGWLKREAAAARAGDSRRSDSWLGVPVIIAIERDNLCELLGRAARWLATDADGHRRITAPPMWCARMLLARGSWILPQLEAISDAPVFRPDGSILETPGYDPRTRVIYDPCGAEFPRVPQAPIQSDAADALAELEDPFSEFPFRGRCDRAAAVALVLSMIGRAAIDGSVPMFASQAPTPGSGKGLLVDVAATIVTGRRAPLMAPTEDDDETRKRLLAIAVESPTMVVIDNVEGSLGSPTLAMALTAGVVSDRVLGVTKLVSASLRPVWCCTGNNVQLKGDLGRRVVPIDLDPACEHPEDRTFERGDLLAYVGEHRPRLVTAALTILRAYAVAGYPAHGMPVKGSFESWDRLVRGAIIWSGGEDPLAGVARIREQGDEDIERLRALLAAWHSSLGEMPVSLAGAIRHCEVSGELKEAMSAYCKAGRPDARQLGYVLRRNRDRAYAGLVLRNAGLDRTQITTWVVRQI